MTYKSSTDYLILLLAIMPANQKPLGLNLVVDHFVLSLDDKYVMVNDLRHDARESVLFKSDDVTMCAMINDIQAEGECYD